MGAGSSSSRLTAEAAGQAAGWTLPPSHPASLRNLPAKGKSRDERSSGNSQEPMSLREEKKGGWVVGRMGKMQKRGGGGGGRRSKHSQGQS